MENQVIIHRTQLYWDQLIKIKFTIAYLDQYEVHASRIISILNAFFYIAFVLILAAFSLNLNSSIIQTIVILATALNVIFSIASFPYQTFQKKYYLSKAISSSLKCVFHDAIEIWEDLYSYDTYDPEKIKELHNYINRRFKVIIDSQYDSSLFPENKKFKKKALENTKEFFKKFAKEDKVSVTQ